MDTEEICVNESHRYMNDNDLKLKNRLISIHSFIHRWESFKGDYFNSKADTNELFRIVTPLGDTHFVQ